MATRLYRVTHKDTGEERLVEATTPGAAMAFVMGDHFDVTVPSPREALEMSKRGIIHEQAPTRPRVNGAGSTLGEPTPAAPQDAYSQSITNRDTN